jgi:PAS domain S-box-containing protein
MPDNHRSSFTPAGERWKSAPRQHLLRLDRLEPALTIPLLDISLDGYLLCDAERICLYANRAACGIFGRSASEMQGQPVEALFPHREREMSDLFTLRSGRWSEIILRSGGEKREVECMQTVVESQGEWFTIIMIRDMTELHQLERKAEVLAQFATNMACADSLEATLNALARSFVQATGAMACLVPLISGTPPQFRVIGSYGLPPGYAAGLGNLVRKGVFLPTLQAFEERRIVVAEGVRHLHLADPRRTPVHPFLREASWDTLVCIPLIYRGESLGAFTVYCPPGPPPGEGEIAFYSAIADQAAVAVENARLLVAAQEKAALEERQRLARELHDSVSQGLYGITLGAQAARAFMESDQALARESLDYVLSLARATHTEMRSLIFALHPESLASEGIVEALNRRAAAICARHELRVETHLCDEPDLPLEMKEALYRIAQEALHNIVKHAHAHCCQLLLYQHPETIVLEVIDDGVGFDPSTTFPGHLGLHSMRERAMHLGGLLEISSIPGKQTRVRVVIPCPEQ